MEAEINELKAHNADLATTYAQRDIKVRKWKTEVDEAKAALA